MKIYKPKKWLTISRLCLLVFFVLFISTSNIGKTSISTIENENLNKAISHKELSFQQKELYLSSLYEPISSFVGDLTGYAGNCPLCSGVVACKRINVLEEGILYTDQEYGEVRMVASSKRYPCGSVIRFTNQRISEDPIIAIVLDRGVGGNDIDLLMSNEEEAKKYVGRMRNLEFDILRLGW